MWREIPGSRAKKRAPRNDGGIIEYRHCEERSDEAIQLFTRLLDCFASLAMT
jgi:hypothetical protein